MEQQRVFLALALSMALIFVWQYFFAPPPLVEPPPAPGVEAGDKAPEGQGDQAGAGQDSVGKPAGTPATPPAKKDVALREDMVLATDAFKATFTNKGGRLKGFELIKPHQYSTRGDMVRPLPDEDGNINPAWEKYLPFGLEASGQLPGLGEETMYEVVEATEETVLLRHEVPGVYKLDKRFSLDKDRKSLALDITLTNSGSLQIKDQLQLIVYGHQPSGSGEWSFFNPLPDITEGLCYVKEDEEAIRAPKDDAEEGVKVEDASIWGGVDSRYFITAVISKEKPFAGCDLTLQEQEFFRSSLQMSKISLEPGQSQSWSMQTYIGPKLVETMALYDASLEESIDYGFFAVLSKPIRWLLVLFHGWVGNWGFAIILMTMMLRLMLFPINHKAYKNMEGMRKIQEPMTKLREQYKDDPMKMQEEMMKLYRDHNVSPFGCLPQFLQIPIFFALYRTIYSSVELYNAEFFGWYTDLSAPDPFFVLPVLVGLMMVGQQLLMPQTATNPQMKYIMWAMPVMFAAFTFLLPSGLALYMLVSIGLGIAQQFYIRKTLAKDDETKGAKPAKA